MRISTLTGTSLATAAAGAIGSIVTRPAVETWYPRLKKPSFVPPAWVFPVAWTALYTDIAVTSAVAIDGLDESAAGATTGDAKNATKQAYLAALGANLALNGAWSWIYFGKGALGTASVAAAVLTVSSADLARRTGAVNAPAGAALAAYPAWCAFATVLSTSTWWLNRDRDLVSR
ncbi:TspO/MBR family protein [Gordonia amicalis]|uniref:TspO/MBR family protein n=1 Tax=Gordonia amicalis TaxID=89053 RepID=UPI000587CF88|nr:TspO/MBR family protein [Gordonia amicalis]MCZ4652758.1 tryptophan-rich sensory protein [Gordonia amicalis]MDJ0454140.1 TspO/MBR family protein [Gordonia amicalis]MDV7077284.1 TspO/MBR family protein [Gordonia amicalis]NKX76382.1 tryptophan-rich sensory protein [Gordonia amicalis]